MKEDAREQAVASLISSAADWPDAYVASWPDAFGRQPDVKAIIR